MRFCIRLLFIVVLMLTTSLVMAQTSEPTAIAMGDTVTGTRTESENPRYALSIPANTPHKSH